MPARAQHGGDVYSCAGAPATSVERRLRAGRRGKDVRKNIARSCRRCARGAGTGCGRARTRARNVRARAVSDVHLTGGRKAARTGMFECCAGDGEHVARERALSSAVITAELRALVREWCVQCARPRPRTHPRASSPLSRTSSSSGRRTWKRG
jgi:hypothetical protein